MKDLIQWLHTMQFVVHELHSHYCNTRLSRPLLKTLLPGRGNNSLKSRRFFSKSSITMVVYGTARHLLAESLILLLLPKSLFLLLFEQPPHRQHHKAPKEVGCKWSREKSIAIEVNEPFSSSSSINCSWKLFLSPLFTRCRRRQQQQNGLEWQFWLRWLLRQRQQMLPTRKWSRHKKILRSQFYRFLWLTVKSLRFCAFVWFQFWKPHCSIRWLQM